MDYIWLTVRDVNKLEFARPDTLKNPTLPFEYRELALEYRGVVSYPHVLINTRLELAYFPQLFCDIFYIDMQTPAYRYIKLFFFSKGFFLLREILVMRTTFIT